MAEAFSDELRNTFSRAHQALDHLRAVQDQAVHRANALRFAHHPKEIERNKNESAQANAEWRRAQDEFSEANKCILRLLESP